MKKKGLLKGFLICTIAALSFTACGKKKDNATTKDNTTTVAPTPTPDPTPSDQDNVKKSSYYAKEDNGILAMEVRESNSKLQFVSLITSDMEGMPTLLQPILENNQVTKLKLYAFLSTGDSSVFFIRTIELKEDGIVLPTDLRCTSGEYAGSSSIFVKKDEGKLVLYNRELNVTFSADGTVTTSDFVATTEAPTRVGDYTMTYKNGLFSMDINGEKYNSNLDPTNLNVTMSMWSNYLKKFVNVAKYQMDVTSANPVAKLYGNSIMIKTMSGSGESDYGILYDEGLADMGTITPVLDANGNVTSCTMEMEMYGMKETDVTTLDYNDKGQLVKVNWGRETVQEYQYTYDDKGRVKTFKEGKIVSNAFSPKNEYTFGYTDYGYKSSCVWNDVNNSRKWEYNYHYYTENNKLERISTLLDKGSGFKQYNEELYSYYDTTGLLEEIRTEYSNAEDEANDTRTVYTYDESGNMTKRETFGKKLVGSDYEEYLFAKETYESDIDTDNHYYDQSIYTSYNTNSTVSYTRTITSTYLDADRLYLLSSIDSYQYTTSTSYTATNIVYDETSKLITSYVQSEKESSETNPTVTTYTYTYVNNTITTINDKQVKGSTVNYDITNYYNDAALAYKAFDNRDKSVDKMYYDTNRSMIRYEEYDYVSETIPEQLSKVAEFGFGVPNLPSKMVEYEYDSSNKLKTSSETIFDTVEIAMMAMMGFGNPSKVINKNYTDGILVSENIAEFNEGASDPSKVIARTYGADELVLTELTNLYDANGAMTKETYAEKYTNGKLKEEYEKNYTNSSVTSGTRKTYTDATPQAVTEYTWDTVTAGWKEVTA